MDAFHYFRELESGTKFSVDFNGEDEMMKIDDIYDRCGNVVVNAVNLENGSVYCFREEMMIELCNIRK